jgi:hypothetical protein
MHTVSETGHTGDVLAAVHGMHALCTHLDADVAANTSGSGAATPAAYVRQALENTHPRLDAAPQMQWLSNVGGSTVKAFDVEAELEKRASKAAGDDVADEDSDGEGSK